MIAQNLLDQLEALKSAAKAEGVSFIGCLAKYTKEEAYFLTTNLTIENKDAGVSEMHITLDCIREMLIGAQGIEEWRCLEQLEQEPADAYKLGELLSDICAWHNTKHESQIAYSSDTGCYAFIVHTNKHHAGE